MQKNDQPDRLREALRILVRRLGVLERSEASCCDITLNQCHTIVEIGRAGCLSVNELAEILGLEKSSVSRSVDNLVNDNIILRATDPDDRRYVTLRLSDQGQTIFAEMEKRMAEFFEEVLMAIPENIRSQVLESLHYLVAALIGSRCCALKGPLEGISPTNQHS